MTECLFSNRKKVSGFTLIEVLIALAIIAIALTAIVKASASNVEDAIYLQNKNIANLMANNILAEAQLGLITPAASQPRKLLNTTLYWTLVQSPTPEKNVFKETVYIRTNPSKNVLVSLWGFKYA